ncbi:hypothetical protein [Acetobacterium bakii]|uniref:Uncharacterized protein n=1 Tax=Acetobacterium bakii TaxID=52689 RepID=A0A0L6TYQ6_9FIRM|nr:hypothetical protein [Acetobacterium bakii]KNZ41368.1 hypothetical protein AKG39_12150 [Acetobacterium bakii]
MQYDLTTLLTTIVGCTSTIIAILGGFISSKIIQINTEHIEIKNNLESIQKELEFKREKRREKISMEFINSKIDDFIDIEEENDLNYIYQNSLEWWIIDYDELRLFCEKASKGWILVRNARDANPGEPLNKDGIPEYLVQGLDKFQTEVCKNGIAKKYGNGSSDDLENNTKKLEKEIEDLEESIKYFEFQEEQLELKKKSFIQFPGIQSGLIIFGIFSIISIIIPLTLIPFSTTDFQIYTRARYGIIMGFIFCLFSVFIYFAAFLNSKE